MFGTRKAFSLFASLGAALLASGAAQAQVTTNVYFFHTNVGGGTLFSALVGTLNTPDVQFATNTGGNWHPFGLSDFGSDSTGFLSIPTTGSYTFDLISDDGSLLFIDGGLVVDNGGPHGFKSVIGTATLSVGVHPFEVQFFENGFGQSGVDLNLPQGVTFTTSSVPEPGAIALLIGAGVSGLGFAARRRRAR